MSGLSQGWESPLRWWTVKSKGQWWVPSPFPLITEQLAFHFIPKWNTIPSFIKYVHSIKYGLAVGFTSVQLVTVFPVWPKLFVMVLWSGKWLYTFQKFFLRCFKLFHCNMEQILAFQPWKKASPLHCRNKSAINWNKKPGLMHTLPSIYPIMFCPFWFEFSIISDTVDCWRLGGLIYCYLSYTHELGLL